MRAQAPFMHANVVRLRYKSEADVEKGVNELKGLAEELPGMPGFQSFTLVRTGEKETLHGVRFTSEEDARHAREALLLPRERSRAADGAYPARAVRRSGRRRPGGATRARGRNRGSYRPSRFAEAKRGRGDLNPRAHRAQD